MKKESKTTKSIPLILIFAGILLIPMTLAGQVSHTITTANFSFSPNELTINTGDTVIWKNTSGSHNVNGTTATYPSNPESFGNDVGMGWIYTHVFNIPGNYDYRCDPHFSLGMTGKIIVQQTSAVNKLPDEEVLLYPNPAREYITVDLQQTNEKLRNIKLLDLLGKELVTYSGINGATRETLDISRFNPGIYFLQVETDSRIGSYKIVIR